MDSIRSYYASNEGTPVSSLVKSKRSAGSDSPDMIQSSSDVEPLSTDSASVIAVDSGIMIA